MPRPAANLIGKKFLLLTVIERSSESVGSKNSSWLCKCDCGRFVVLSKRTLERMSFNCYCGSRECLNKYNSNLILIGDKVGTLKILSKIKTKSDFIYETFCVKCNDSAHYQQNHFRKFKKGEINYSCRNCNIKNVSEQAINNFKKNWFNSYKKSAKEKNRVFDLNEKDFFKISNLNCFYCNSSPQERKINNKNKDIIYLNGIDRIDSAGGYSLNNIVPCCTKCNFMKKEYDMEMFFTHIINIYKFQNSKEKSWEVLEGAK